MADENSGLGISFLGREGSGEAQILGEQPNAAQTYLQNVAEEKARRAQELASKKPAKNPEYDLKYDTPHEKLMPYLQEKVNSFQDDLSEAIQNGSIQDPRIQAEFNKRDYELRNQHAIAGVLKKQDKEQQEYALKNPDKIHYKTYLKGRSDFLNNIPPEELLNGEHPLPLHGGIVDRNKFASALVGHTQELEVGAPTKSVRRAPNGTSLIEDTKQMMTHGSPLLSHRMDASGNITTDVSPEMFAAHRNNSVLEGSFAMDAERNIQNKILSRQLPPEAASDPEVMNQEMDRLAKEDILLAGGAKNHFPKITPREYEDIAAKERAKIKGSASENAPVTSTSSEPQDNYVNDVQHYTEGPKKGQVVLDKKGEPVTVPLKQGSQVTTRIEPIQKNGKRISLDVTRNQVRDIEKIDLPGAKTGHITVIPTSLTHNPVNEKGQSHLITAEEALKRGSKHSDFINGYYIDEDKAKNDAAFNDLLKAAKNSDDYSELANDKTYSKYIKFVQLKPTNQDLDLLEKKGVNLSAHKKVVSEFNKNRPKSNTSSVGSADDFMKKYGK